MHMYKFIWHELNSTMNYTHVVLNCCSGYIFAFKPSLVDHILSKPYVIIIIIYSIYLIYLSISIM